MPGHYRRPWRRPRDRTATWLPRYRVCLPPVRSGLPGGGQYDRSVLPQHAVQRSALIWRLWRILPQGRVQLQGHSCGDGDEVSRASGWVVSSWCFKSVQILRSMRSPSDPDSGRASASGPSAHLPVPAHDRAVALSGKGQRPGGVHYRAGCARTEPMRPVEPGQLHHHLPARPAHAGAEPCPQPDGQRSEQLRASHRRVERRLVREPATVSNTCPAGAAMRT